VASVLYKSSSKFDNAAARKALPPLENGDHLDQKTFHERYRGDAGRRSCGVNRRDCVHGVAHENAGTAATVPA